jgi:hypothetical protein
MKQKGVRQHHHQVKISSYPQNEKNGVFFSFWGYFFLSLMGMYGDPLTEKRVLRD